MFGSLPISPSKATDRAAGFTLVEVMVAVAILAVTSTLIFTGLRAVVKTHETVEREERMLSQLQVLHTLLSRDLEEVVERPEGRVGGQAFVGEPTAMAFVRLSLMDTPFPESSLRRVTYGVQDGALYRTILPRVDPGPGVEAARQRMVEGVRQFSLRFLGQTSEWFPEWRSERWGGDPPRGVELLIQLDGWGVIQWFFPIAEAVRLSP